MNKHFWIVFLILSIFLILFSFYPIDLPTADIGRHIVNGNILLHSNQFNISISRLLHSNLFSYTYPEFPFVNHHWLSGILISIIYTLFSFGGLSLFYFLLILTTLFLALLTTKKHSDNLYVIAITSIFLIPLLASRKEVRPEGLSFVFISLFIYILSLYAKTNDTDKKFKNIWLLPLIELFWVNTHIYFIFGPFIVGVFFLEELLKKNWGKVKEIFYVLFCTSMATILNPYGIKGAIYPFMIFQNYGYRIVENQSISFLEGLSFANPDFLWYKITVFLIILTSIFIFIKDKINFKWALSILTFTFGILGYKSIRSIPLFAITALPLLVHNITIIKNYLENKFKKIEKDNLKIFYGVLFLIVLVTTIVHFNDRILWSRDFQIGINQKDLGSLDFIKNNKITGPFFNNYDIGGFMIFGLFPKEKVFVDNRPEAYPKEFFSQVYIPMQENEDLWKDESVKNKFNVIFFYRLDYTPWGQKFLIDRIKDPAWAPVFVEKETIIFLKRNKQNTEVIKKYELPKEMFTIK